MHKFAVSSIRFLAAVYITAVYQRQSNMGMNRSKNNIQYNLVNVNSRGPSKMFHNNYIIHSNSG